RSVVWGWLGIRAVLVGKGCSIRWLLRLLPCAFSCCEFLSPPEGGGGMHLPARPTCAVKGACKGVHRSAAQTLYSAGPDWADEPIKCNRLNGTFRSMLSYLDLPA